MSYLTNILLVVCAVWIVPNCVLGKCSYPRRFAGSTELYFPPSIPYDYVVDFDDQKAALIRKDKRGFRFFDYNAKKLYEQVDGQCKITVLSSKLNLPVIDPATAHMFRRDRYDKRQHYIKSGNRLNTYNNPMTDVCRPSSGSVFEYKYYFFSDFNADITSADARARYPNLSKCK